MPEAEPIFSRFAGLEEDLRRHPKDAAFAAGWVRADGMIGQVMAGLEKLERFNEYGLMARVICAIRLYARHHPLKGGYAYPIFRIISSETVGEKATSEEGRKVSGISDRFMNGEVMRILKGLVILEFPHISRFVCQLGLLLHEEGRLKQALQALEIIHESLGGLDRRERVEYLACLAELRILVDKYAVNADMMVAIQEALDASQHQDFIKERAWVLRTRGIFEYRRKETQSAISWLEESILLLDWQGDIAGVSAAYQALYAVLNLRGAYEEAIERTGIHALMGIWVGVPVPKTSMPGPGGWWSDQGDSAFHRREFLDAMRAWASSAKYLREAGDGPGVLSCLRRMFLLTHTMQAHEASLAVINTGRKVCMKTGASGPARWFDYAEALVNEMKKGTTGEKPAVIDESIPEGHPRWFYERAEDAYRKGDWVKAHELAVGGVKVLATWTGPDRDDFMENLHRTRFQGIIVRSLVGLGRQAEAEEVFHSTIDPRREATLSGFVTYLLMIARESEKKGMPEAAVKYAEKAIWLGVSGLDDQPIPVKSTDIPNGLEDDEDFALAMGNAIYEEFSRTLKYLDNWVLGNANSDAISIVTRNIEGSAEQKKAKSFLAHFEKTLLAAARRSDSGMVNTVVCLARLKSVAGDNQRAEEMLKFALTLSLDRGNSGEKVAALCAQALLKRNSGDENAAHRLESEALELARELGDVRKIRELDESRGGNEEVIRKEVESDVGAFLATLEASKGKWKVRAGNKPGPAEISMLRCWSEIFTYLSFPDSAELLFALPGDYGVKSMIRELGFCVLGGFNVSDWAVSYPELFDAESVAMLKKGEAEGNLDKAIPAVVDRVDSLLVG